jgi:hypothetical protein
VTAESSGASFLSVGFSMLNSESVRIANRCNHSASSGVRSGDLSSLSMAPQRACWTFDEGWVIYRYWPTPADAENVASVGYATGTCKTH